MRCSNPQDPFVGPLARKAPAIERGFMTIEQICGDCELRATKPGHEDTDLAELATTALSLAELVECGVRFSLAELTPEETAALRALHRGRENARRQEREEKEAEAQRNRVK
ncbi:MAG: hypothetical protein U0Z53_29020 [Blastocatellia bacterium]